MGSHGGGGALRVPSLASSAGSAPPSRPRRATSRPLASPSLLPGPRVPTGKWPPLPPGDSRLWQEATTRSDLFLPASGCLVTDRPICEVTLLRLWQTPPFLVASFYPRLLPRGQPGHKHRLALTLQPSFCLSLSGVEMTLVPTHRSPTSLRRPQARTADDDLGFLTGGRGVVLCSSTVRTCIFKSSPSPSSTPAISPHSSFRMIGISCSANLFYCFCLHLPKGDYN